MLQSSVKNLVRFLYVKRLKHNRLLGRVYIVSNYEDGHHLNLAYNDYQLQGWEYYTTLLDFLESDGCFQKVAKENPSFDEERVRTHGTAYFYAPLAPD